MEPNDEHLCIVPSRRGTGRLYLPFPEDTRFSVIVSTAFLLAADDRITDPTIVAQIARPPGDPGHGRWENADARARRRSEGS